MTEAMLIAENYAGLVPKNGDVFDLTLAQWNGILNRIEDRHLASQSGESMHTANIKLVKRRKSRRKAKDRRRGR